MSTARIMWDFPLWEYLKNKRKHTAIDIEIHPIAAEMDEMWSYYYDKSHQLWLWWAVEHESNIPLAYTFGTREHKYLDELLTLLKPFPIGTVYADNNYAYRERLSTGRHTGFRQKEYTKN